MNQPLEKRNYKRVHFVAEVFIKLGEQKWQCNLIDISLKGVLVERPEGMEMQANAVYTISLVLSADVAIRMKAKIVHSQPHLWGFQWVDIDLDSFTNLRALLEHNLADRKEIHRELNDLVDKL